MALRRGWGPGEGWPGKAPAQLSHRGLATTQAQVPSWNPRSPLFSHMPSGEPQLLARSVGVRTPGLALLVPGCVSKEHLGRQTWVRTPAFRSCGAQPLHMTALRAQGPGCVAQPGTSPTQVPGGGLLATFSFPFLPDLSLTPPCPCPTSWHPSFLLSCHSHSHTRPDAPHCRRRTSRPQQVLASVTWVHGSCSHGNKHYKAPSANGRLLSLSLPLSHSPRALDGPQGTRLSPGRPVCLPWRLAPRPRRPDAHRVVPPGPGSRSGPLQQRGRETGQAGWGTPGAQRPPRSPQSSL